MRKPFGGVRLRDQRELARDRAIENAPIPAVCVIAMRQDGRAGARCVVEAGDVVAEGHLVGRAHDDGSTNVHTPVPGRVAAIREIRMPDGRNTEAVVVELEGRFARSGKPQHTRDWQRMGPERIAQALREQGVLGLGGETFPTRLIHKPRMLLVNGVESEPYLTGGHRLLLERTGRIVAGTRIVERLLDPARVVVALDGAEPALVSAVEGELRRLGLVWQVAALDAHYPWGQPRYILEEITGRPLVPPKQPEDAGCVVVSVDTLNAVYEAVVFDQPLVDRVVTVSGAVNHPSNLKVRLGTPVGELIEECGGLVAPDCRVVLGGPMTGLALQDLDTPVTKSVRGVVVVPGREARPRVTSCISCGECIRVCPEGLSPVVLHKQVTHGRIHDALESGLGQCTECGCCAWACPSGIDLVASFEKGKARSRGEGGT